MPMLFIVISETMYSYLCCNRELVCSMLSSDVFQKTSPQSLARIRGVPVSLGRGVTGLGIRAGLAVQRPSPLER